MLFLYSNRVEVQYGVYGPASGRTHRGIDVDTVDSDWRVLATVSGKVTASTIITNHADLTWEWGNYVAIVDPATNYKHHYCHLASRSVKVGDMVKKGQPIGVMGKTGNASGDKQSEHVHYEVRKYPWKSADAIDPTPWAGIPNAVGTYLNTKPSEPSAELKVGNIVQFVGGPVYTSSGSSIFSANRGPSKCEITILSLGSEHEVHLISRDGGSVWGWVDRENVLTQPSPVEPEKPISASLWTVKVGPMSKGDKDAVERLANSLDLQYTTEQIE